MNIIARVAAFLLATSLPMEDATAKAKSWPGGGLVVENSEWVEADPQAVWKAFVEDVDKWWPADFTRGGDPSTLSMEATAGGGLHEGEGEGESRQMTIMFVVPGKLVRTAADLGPLRGLDPRGALEWRFDSESGGTRITLRYRAGDSSPDDISEIAQVIAGVQAMQLAGLVTWLDHPSDEYPEAG
ncbi:MAG TPA: SRPBCC family protein [Luteimonas sp.]|nr:SRPBCC family protein [Luteimonas sp.]HRO27305.1 SRPBCC family protein [Luteimonas sp.]HRP72028.1 SRPBCC family protein [Luteimonas sp.]